MEVHILYAFMEAYKDFFFSLVCCTKQLVALKIVSNLLSSVKQDRNYFNPKARWVQKSYEK